MTLERLQGIILRLGNQMFVRHYLWLNYPNDPQMMGIELIGQAPKGRLAAELIELGFVFNAKDGVWEIERSQP